MRANTISTILLSTVATTMAFPSSLAARTAANIQAASKISHVDVSSLVIPIEAGLPDVPANLTLVHVVIGQGIQNYTCTVPNTTVSNSTSTEVVASATNAYAVRWASSATTSPPSTTSTASTAAFSPKSIGAIAKLHNLDHILTASNINFDDATLAIPCAADILNNGLGFAHVGNHFFSDIGVPIFNLTSFGLQLAGKRSDDLPAPSSACTGRNGAGAVDWLYLVDNESGLSNGLSAVYRTVTAGGLPLASECTYEGQVISSDYAAIYWFLASA